MLEIHLNVLDHKQLGIKLLKLQTGSPGELSLAESHDFRISVLFSVGSQWVL